MVKEIEEGSTGKEREGWLIPVSKHVFSNDTAPVRGKRKEALSRYRTQLKLFKLRTKMKDSRS